MDRKAKPIFSNFKANIEHKAKIYGVEAKTITKESIGNASELKLLTTINANHKPIVINHK